MQSIVQGLTSIPGVMGGMISDEQGNVLAHSFPAFFDLDALNLLAGLLPDNTLGLQDATGGIRSFDMRFELGRVIIKPLPKVFLSILCQPTVNIQLLFISLNVAIKKLEKLAETGGLAPPPAPQAAQPQQQPKRPSSPAYTEYRALTDDKGVLLACDLVKKTATTFWESMTDSCSVNRDTSIEIADFFKSGPFKKLTITNTKNGLSKHVPVSIIHHDRDHAYDGKILLTLGLSEYLKVSVGDQVRVEIVVGGGILGWDGI